MASWTGQSCGGCGRAPVCCHLGSRNGVCPSLPTRRWVCASVSWCPEQRKQRAQLKGLQVFPGELCEAGPCRGRGGATSSRSPLPAASVVCPQGYAEWPLSVPRGILGGLWPSPAARWPPGSQGPGIRGLKGSAAAADLGLLEGHASGRGARGLGGAVAPLGSRGSLTPPAGRSGGAQCKGPGPSLEWGLCGRVPFSFTLRWLCLGRRSIPQSPISS